MYNKIKELFKTSFNMKNLREYQDTLYENKIGVYPCMTVLLKDLFQISDTKKNTNYNGLFNVEKTIFNGKLITKFFLSIDLANNFIASLNLQPDQEIIDFIIKCEVWNTERINVVSELRQPKKSSGSDLKKKIKENQNGGDVENLNSPEEFQDQQANDISTLINNRKKDHKLSSSDWKLICMGGTESPNFFFFYFI
jgi:hypothetical protein